MHSADIYSFGKKEPSQFEIDNIRRALIAEDEPKAQKAVAVELIDMTCQQVNDHLKTLDWSYGSSFVNLLSEINDVVSCVKTEWLKTVKSVSYFGDEVFINQASILVGIGGLDRNRAASPNNITLTPNNELIQLMRGNAPVRLSIFHRCSVSVLLDAQSPFKLVKN